MGVLPAASFRGYRSSLRSRPLKFRRLANFAASREVLT
jgi:hypothetical protein